MMVAGFLSRKEGVPTVPALKTYLDRVKMLYEKVAPWGGQEEATSCFQIRGQGEKSKSLDPSVGGELAASHCDTVYWKCGLASTCAALRARL